MKLEGEKRKDHISMIILYKIDEIFELLEDNANQHFPRERNLYIL